MSTSITIKIKEFEGPMDLLLHLVNQYKVDINEVPLVEVIEQYLDYLDHMTALALDVASEYLVIASQLLLIKSRRLLPSVSEDFESETLDLEEALITQITAYKQYKQLSLSLDQKHHDRAGFMSRPRLSIIAEDVQLAKDKSAIDLYLAFSMVLSKYRQEYQDQHTTITADQFSIEEKMADLDGLMRAKRRCQLTDIFKTSRNLDELITLFLALLEMIKVSTISFSQSKTFGQIDLEYREVGNHD